MQLTYSADRPSSCGMQERGGVSALAPPVAGRHTTARSGPLSSRREAPSAVTIHEHAGFSNVQDRTLLWATAGDRDVMEQLARHPHQVRLPAWTCVACELAWPCTPARSDLLQTLGWMKVATFSVALMDLAVKDLRALNPEQLWQRFIEWTEPPTAARESFLNPHLNRPPVVASSALAGAAAGRDT
jgi:hypothetical protein